MLKNKLFILVLILLTFAIFFIPQNSLAKKGLRIFNVDKSEFPKMKLHYYLFNNEIQVDPSQYTIDDFELFENGKSMNLNSDLTQNLKIVCGSNQGDYPLQIAFIVDVTASMDAKLETNKEVSRFEATKTILAEFIDSLKFDNGTISTIVPFSSNVSNPNSIEWIDNKTEFLNKVDDLELITGARTDHNSPFGLSKNKKFDIFEHFNKIPNIYRRVIVFITDGEHNNSDGVDFKHVEVANLGNENDIEINTMTVHNQWYFGLQWISQETGGKNYIIKNYEEFQEDMMDIYSRTQGSAEQKCWLEYTTDITCIDLIERKIELQTEIFNFPKLTDTITYIAPESISINLKPESGQYIYYFSENTNGSNIQTIKLNAINGDINVSDIIITPNTGEFNIDQTSFTVDKDKSKEITITFTDDGDGISQKYNLEFVADCVFDDLVLIATCGGEYNDLVDFGSVPFSSNPTESITFKNTTASIIEGNVQLGGTDANKFNIISGNGAFQLAENETVTVEIEFNADEDGDYSAFIDFGIYTECGDAISNLKASTKQGNFSIINENWGLIRVLSTESKTYSIINSTGSKLTIDQIEITNDNTSSFELDLKANTLPVELANSETIILEILFTPQSENKFQANLEVTSNEFGVASANLLGEGSQPQLRTMTLIFPGTPVSTESEPMDFIIYNDSKTEILQIEEVKFDDSDPNFVDFKWENGTILTNLEIPTEGSISLPVIFIPQTEENLKELKVMINHNGVGNNQQFFSTNSEGKVVGSSPGSDAIIINDIDMGTVFVCGEYERIFEYNNISDEDIIISFSNLQDGFSINPPNVSIAANTTENFTIKFAPENEGDVNISVLIQSDNGRTGTFNLSAKSEKAKVYSSFKPFPSNNFYTPNDIVKPELTVNVEPINGFNLTELKLIYKYTERHISPTNLNSLPTNIKVLNTNNGQLELVITDDFISGNEFSYEFEFDTYLWIEDLADLSANIISVDNDIISQESCIDHLQSELKIPILSCANELNSISLVSPSSLKNIENKIIDRNFYIEFETGYENENTKIQIFNTHGEVIATLINRILPKGKHKVFFPTDEISNGVYFVKMNHLIYQFVQKVMILK